MSRFFIILFVVILLIGAVLGGLFGRGNSLSADGKTLAPPEKIRRDYAEAVKVVKENYAGEIGEKFFEDLTEGSIQGMLHTLDPHSSFFTRAEFQKLNEDQASRFYGIGVSILQHRDGVYVDSVIEDSPAQRAGFHYGDKFLLVDGKDATEWTSAEVSKNVRGERGTAVKVKMERPGVKNGVEFEIVRDAIPYPSIRNVFMLRPEVGYIAFTGGFQETSDDELDDSIEALRKEGMKQLVLDLRNNPGGLLPQAVSVSSKFVPRGESILSVKGRTRTETRNSEFRSTGDNSNGTQNLPLVVVINGGSASASEIVAGAIQDHGRGLVVGETSFGKGLVQRVFELRPWSVGLTLTTARYYTPYGRSLQRDYSGGSLYDYYKHENLNEEGKAAPSATPTGSPVRTAGGRIFYGGGGIEPDIRVAPQEFSPVRNRIAEAAFYFTRQIAAGQIAGLENYRVERQQFDHVLRPTDFPVTDKVVEAFKEFVNKDAAHGLQTGNITSDLEYTKVRLREEMITAAFASETGQQVLLEVDPQIIKAVEVLPESKKLAESAKK